MEKNKTRYATAMQFFDVVLVCISLPISQVLRGSSYFSIVCSLTGCHWIAIYKAYAFDVLNRQHTLSFSSSYPIKKCVSLISRLLYLLFWELFTLMPCASKILLAPVGKIYCFTITLFSYAFLLALVPIVQLIQNDLFDGGECGDEVLNFVSLSNFTLLTFLAM